MGFFNNMKLKVNILTTFSLLIFLAIICEILYSSYATRSLILGFEKEYYSKTVLNSASKRIDDYFEKIELATLLISAGQADINDSELTQEQRFNALESIDCMQSVYTGFNDSSFFQTSKIIQGKQLKTTGNADMPEKAKYFVRKVFNKNNNLSSSIDYLGTDLNGLFRENIQKTDYLCNKRGWFVQAQLEKKGIWTEIYTDYITGSPCVTYAIPMKSKNGIDFIGVTGIDIILDNIKPLLSFAKISKNSQCYLISDKDEVIAYLENEEPTQVALKKSAKNERSATKDEPKEPASKLITINEFKDPKLQNTSKLLLAQDETHGSFVLGDEVFVCSKAKLSKLPFTLLVVSPEDDFTGALPMIRLYMLLISLCLLLISFIVIYFLSRRISVPLVRLCESAKAIGALDFDNYTEPPASGIKEIQDLSSSVSAMKISVTTFTKYTPKDLVKRMLNLGMTPKLGGESKNITILFSDIESFSTVSEHLPAEYLILHLSEYFDELTKNIMAHGGVIDKYIGDSIMATWGGLNKDENQSVNACRAALSCQELLQALKTKWTPLGKPPLPTRIGIHTGEAIVGNIGCQDRMNYTSIGDNVNLASRLESANKFYGTYMLVSETVENEARGQILFRIVDCIAVKGKAKGVKVYQPLCAMDDQSNPDYYKHMEFCSKTKEAFDIYQSKEFQKAAKHYQTLIKNFPEHEKSLSFLRERCLALIDNCPDDWDGVFHSDKK